jgi:hypothetical protein
MKRIDELFNVHRARSEIFSKYKAGGAGDVPYVGNGLSDNAVAGLVKPRSKDIIFEFAGIAISAFCEASVQVPPFVGCGRAGNGVVILEPKSAMTIAEMAYFAAYINLAVRWRFSWYWQTTATRIMRLRVPDKAPQVQFAVREALPKMSKPESNGIGLRFERVALSEIYELIPGDYHSVGHRPPGPIPVVSCGDLDNGVCGYFDITKHVYDHKMTIAFNGSTLSAKYHPYRFAAKDDVAVCVPKKPLRLTTELFIQVMLRREQWRFSYYRKCFKAKLERVTVPLPKLGDAIDEAAIQSVMKATPYWKYLHERLGV